MQTTQHTTKGNEMILDSIKNWNGEIEEWQNLACNFAGITDAELNRRMQRLVDSRFAKRQTIDSVLAAYDRQQNQNPTTELAASDLRDAREQLTREMELLRRFMPPIINLKPFHSISDALAILRNHCRDTIIDDRR